MSVQRSRRKHLDIQYVESTQVEVTIPCQHCVAAIHFNSQLSCKSVCACACVRACVRACKALRSTGYYFHKKWSGCEGKAGLMDATFHWHNGAQTHPFTMSTLWIVILFTTLCGAAFITSRVQDKLHKPQFSTILAVKMRARKCNVFPQFMWQKV